MATQQQIAKEHKMSFEAVVRLYAEHGHSMTDTANIIGYDPAAFVRLCDRHDWRRLFVTGQKSVAKLAADQSATGVFRDYHKKALQSAMAANPRYHWVQHNGITDTLAGHARRLGLPYRTVCNRWAAHPGDVKHALSKVSHRKPPSHEARSELRNTIKAGFKL